MQQAEKAGPKHRAGRSAQSHLQPFGFVHRFGSFFFACLPASLRQSTSALIITLLSPIANAAPPYQLTSLDSVPIQLTASQQRTLLIHISTPGEIRHAMHLATALPQSSPEFNYYIVLTIPDDQNIAQHYATNKALKAFFKSDTSRNHIATTKARTHTPTLTLLSPTASPLWSTQQFPTTEKLLEILKLQN